MQDTSKAKLSGRMVLITIVVFFAVITAVNAIMATLAITTFGGVEAENPYRAGLEFAREIAAAKAQQARNLQVDVTPRRLANGNTQFRLSIRNIDAALAAQLQAKLELRHPADRRHDRTLVLVSERAGSFVGELPIEPGQWNVTLMVERGEERVFRSVNRMTIP